jgi:hypothetical protein
MTKIKVALHNHAKAPENKQLIFFIAFYSLRMRDVNKMEATALRLGSANKQTEWIFTCIPRILILSKFFLFTN